MKVRLMKRLDRVTVSEPGCVGTAGTAGTAGYLHPVSEAAAGTYDVEAETGGFVYLRRGQVRVWLPASTFKDALDNRIIIEVKPAAARFAFAKARHRATVDESPALIETADNTPSLF